MAKELNTKWLKGITRIYSRVKMFKLSYCWKCEKIKEQHKLLNKMLPDDLVELVSDYEKCNNCNDCIYFNDHYKEPYEENKDHFKARITIHFLMYKILNNSAMKPKLTVHDYKYIIHNARHPLKKQMLRFLVSPRRGHFKNSAMFLNNLLHWNSLYRDFSHLSEISTGEDREIIQEIFFLSMFEFFRTCCSKKKYSVSEKELRDYLEARMI